MRKISVPSFVAGAVAASVLLAVPVAAVVQTAGSDPHPRVYDGTTPSLTLHPSKFVLGKSIDAATEDTGDCRLSDPWNYAVPVRMHWTGTDGKSGLAGYDLWESAQGLTKILSQTQATSFDFPGSNYTGDCGSDPAINTYFVVATDNRGNSATTTDTAHRGVNVWQESGSTSGYVEPLPVVKVGDWAVAHCICSNQGATYYSTDSADSLTYTIKTTTPAETVAVVAAEGVDHGQMSISVDGGRPVPVDTYATAQNDRVIVWQKTLRMGTHTLTLTNMGTAGHSRIDIDSILSTVTGTARRAGKSE